LKRRKIVKRTQLLLNFGGGVPACCVKSILENLVSLASAVDDDPRIDVGYCVLWDGSFRHVSFRPGSIPSWELAARVRLHEAGKEIPAAGPFFDIEIAQFGFVVDEKEPAKDSLVEAIIRALTQQGEKS
jgi:hypothetical protein